MITNIKEYLLYNNFNELAVDILTLAKEILPDSFLFLSAIVNNEQHILKTSPNTEHINIREGISLPLKVAVCSRIDFTKGIPLVYEDISKESSLDDIKGIYSNTNVNAYLGVPVILRDGEVFGTLCAVHEKAAQFNEKSIKLIEKIAKMLSYYLELEQLAYRDHLTGSYNRHFLERYFNEFAHEDGAIFFLDLDCFKEINDSLGHDTGDLILKEVALRMEAVMRQRNINGAVFRLGGDEFIINLVGKLSVQEIEEIAEAFIERLSSWDFQIKEFNLSVSIGIVQYTNTMKLTLNKLLKKADNALYRAKTSGKSTYCFF
ncbi:diguanylate cyclase [Niallia taxi]|uniref:sensor domain-containing diguanylate cyclase n=1 Tax=Niallia taxi TaxID=2499688 RepID=UPI003982A06E